MNSAASEHVQQELRTLGKAIRAGIDAAEPGDVEDGLRLYGRMVKSVLDRRATFRSQFGTDANSSWWSSAGQEMDWLDRDIESFIDRAFKKPDRRVQEAIATFITRLLDSLRRARQPEHHRALLRHAERFYFRSLGIPLPPQGPSAGETILSAVGAYANFQIGARTQVTRGLGDDLPYLMQVIDFMARTIRASIDRKALERAGEGITQLLDLLEGIEIQTRRTNDRSTTDVDEIRSHVGGYLLGLIAYSLLRAERGLQSDEDAARLISMLSPATRRVPADLAVTAALDDTGTFPWHLWEIDTWPRQQTGGALGRLEDLITAASAIRLAGDPRAAELFIEAIEESTGASNAAYRLRQLATAARRATNDTRLAPARPENLSDRSLTALAEHFDDHAEDLEEEEKDRRAGQSLDTSKIDAFTKQVVDAWTRPSLLRGNPLAPPDMHDPPTTWWGYSQLVPKEFFIQSEVFAEASHIGQSVGTAMVRGENSAVLAILDELPPHERSVSEVKAWVEASLQELRAKGFQPAVVVVNSWLAMREILGADWHSARDEGELDGAKVVLEYTDHPSACYVVDMPRALTLHRWIAPDTEGPLHAEGRLLISVRDVDYPFAVELLRANPALQRSEDGKELEESEAIRRLRRSVHVRAWTKLEVTMGDRNSGVCCHITGAD